MTSSKNTSDMSMNKESILFLVNNDPEINSYLIRNAYKLYRQEVKKEEQLVIHMDFQKMTYVNSDSLINVFELQLVNALVQNLEEMAV